MTGPEAEALFRQRADEDLAEAKRPTVGKLVEVVRGRKVPIGTIGTITRDAFTQYGYRVCIDGPDGEVWTSAGNVEVHDPENYLGDWTAMVEDVADAGDPRASEPKPLTKPNGLNPTDLSAIAKLVEASSRVRASLAAETSGTTGPLRHAMWALAAIEQLDAALAPFTIDKLDAADRYDEQRARLAERQVWDSDRP